MPRVHTENMLRVNAGLKVIRGRSVSLTREDLQFYTDADEEACKVEVVLNEPVTQRVGKLTPQVKTMSPINVIASLTPSLLTFNDLSSSN